MHIELETLPHCITALRVELPPERVAQERQTLLREYQGAAKLPGYRPGKAPAKLVEAKYRKEIGEELQRKLVSAGTREAIAEKKLKVLSVADVEEITLGQDDALSFTAKVITAPEFDLPPYQALPVKTPPPEISEADIEVAVERLRARLGDFVDIEGRGLEMGDFCVIDLAGRFEDKPVAEAFPGAPRELAGQENLWIKMGPGTLLPGFCEALLGAVADDTRTFGLDVPADFPLADLAGKRFDYTVKVRELKRQVLPEVNDEFAGKLIPGKTLEEVKAQLRSEMAAQRVSSIEEMKRDQIVGQLLGGVDFELPEDFVRRESRRIMDGIVRQNQERGISDEEIRTNTTEIIANAAQTAHKRIKSAFILARIAEKEGIKVKDEDLNERLDALAQRHGMPRAKVMRNLLENGGLDGVQEEILLGKTLAFLTSSASVEVVPLETIKPEETDQNTP